MTSTAPTPCSSPDDQLAASLLLQIDDLRTAERANQNLIKALQVRVARAESELTLEKCQHTAAKKQLADEIDRLKTENLKFFNDLDRESKKRKSVEHDLRAYCNGKTEADARVLKQEWELKHYNLDEKERECDRLRYENRRLRDAHELPPPKYKLKMEELKHTYQRGGRRFDTMKTMVLNVWDELQNFGDDDQRIKQLRWRLSKYHEACKGAEYHEDKAAFDEAFRDIED